MAACSLACSSACSFQQLLAETPELYELMEYVNTNKWYSLGVQLKCNTNKLDELDEMKGNNNDKLTKMFQHWLENTSSPSRSQLLRALRKRSVSEIAVAKDYEQYLKSIARKSKFHTHL